MHVIQKRITKSPQDTQGDQLPEKETIQRREETLRRMLKTPPRPRKEKPRKKRKAK
jgi:hypothetical protein